MDEEDTPEETEIKVEGVIASYELLELGIRSGIGTSYEDRLNDVTEAWLVLVSGLGVSEEQIDRIRSQCTLSLSFAKKRAASSSTSYAGMAASGGGSSRNARGRNQKKSKQAPSTPATKKKRSGHQQQSNDNKSQDDGDADDEEQSMDEERKKSLSQSMDDEDESPKLSQVESPETLSDVAAARAAAAAKLRLEQQQMLLQQPKSPVAAGQPKDDDSVVGHPKDDESEQQNSEMESSQEASQQSSQESDDTLSPTQGQLSLPSASRKRSKRPTPMDLAWRQVALDEKEGRIPEFVAETEVEKKMEQMSKDAKRDTAELRRIRQLNADGNVDEYLDAIGEYLSRHRKERKKKKRKKVGGNGKKKESQQQDELSDSPMSSNAGSQSDGEDHDEKMEDAASTMPKAAPRTDPNVRQAKLVKAREYLADMRVQRDNYRNRRGRDRYATPYLLVRLPSLMNQTKELVDGAFGDKDQNPAPMDGFIRGLIQDFIDLYDLGMKSAVSFLDSEDKAWLPITFTSLGALANDLEASITPASEESSQHQEVQRAIEYAKDSNKFDLPKGQSIKYLAKICLTMNEATRNQLFALVHCAAGCGIFNEIDVDDLMIGKQPILSREVLEILKYESKSKPKDANELLCRYRKSFDDERISLVDKTKLMGSFLRIRQEILNLSDEHWDAVDKSGSDRMAEAPRSRYFHTLSRQNKAMLALTMLVASPYIHAHTRSGVEYGEFNTGVDELLYRNSISSIYESIGTKLLMPKTYDGAASAKYMTSIYSGLDDLVEKARTGGRGRERSAHDEDITVLFDLDNDDDEDHDNLLAILGNAEDDCCGNGEDDGMEVEEAVYM